MATHTLPSNARDRRRERRAHLQPPRWITLSGPEGDNQTAPVPAQLTNQRIDAAMEQRLRDAEQRLVDLTHNVNVPRIEVAAAAEAVEHQRLQREGWVQATRAALDLETPAIEPGTVITWQGSAYRLDAAVQATRIYTTTTTPLLQVMDKRWYQRLLIRLHALIGRGRRALKSVTPDPFHPVPQDADPLLVNALGMVKVPATDDPYRLAFIFPSDITADVAAEVFEEIEQMRHTLAQFGVTLLDNLDAGERLLSLDIETEQP